MTDITPNTERYAIVPVYNNKPPSDAIIWGTIGECTEFIAQSIARAEAEERIASTREQLKNDAESLARAQKLTADALPKITALGDALVAAHEKRARKDAEAKRVAAEQAEAKRIQDLLDSLPDPDNPDAGSGDDGDLQSPHHPPDKERHAEHREEDSFGDLPDKIRKRTPTPDIGPDYETNINKLAYPQKPQEQPAAISLNAEVYHGHTFT